MRALEGLKIADFSWVGAGPRSTKDLADHGATVVKVESASRLDLGRMSPPFAGGKREGPDSSAFFAQTNTSKKSVTINLSDPRGVDVARKLVAWADVAVENFGPGYMDRIGLGYAELVEVNPDIILASVSVAGRTGPMSGFRGYGNSAAARSGHAALTGWPGSEPHMPPFAYGDVVAPMFLTVAILAALEHRDRTGEGQHVDVSQIEPMVHVVADLFADPPSDKPANMDPVMAPHGVYPCSGDDQWVAIACRHDADFAALVDVLGRRDLACDARFADAASRKANEADLDQIVADATRQHTKSDLAEQLSARGVPVGPVNDGREVLEHPALEVAGHFPLVEHPVLGTSRMPAPPVRMGETPHKVGPAPCLGEHNEEVFVNFLGMGRQEIQSLADAGVLA